MRLNLRMNFAFLSIYPGRASRCRSHPHLAPWLMRWSSHAPSPPYWRHWILDWVEYRMHHKHPEAPYCVYSFWQYSFWRTNSWEFEIHHARARALASSQIHSWWFGVRAAWLIWRVFFVACCGCTCSVRGRWMGFGKRSWVLLSGSLSLCLARFHPLIHQLWSS